jgi:hypothetical protein
MIPRANRNEPFKPLQWVSVLVTGIIVTAISMEILVLLIGTSKMVVALLFAIIAGTVSGFSNYRAARRRTASHNPAQWEPPG